MKPKHQAIFLIVTSLIAVAALPPVLANAAGALAVGISPAGAQYGFAAGSAWNNPNAGEASSNAIAKCKKSPGSNARAQALCKVVINYENQCVAIALDPKDGTPGAGWGVGATQQQANDAALIQCRATAGANRQAFCEVTAKRCDGTAK
jgi:hypothetical protein